MSFVRYVKLNALYPASAAGIMSMLLGSVTVGLFLMLLAAIVLVICSKEIKEVGDLADSDIEELPEDKPN